MLVVVSCTRPVNTKQALVADTDNDTVMLDTCLVSNSTSGPETKTEVAAHDVTTLLWAVCGPILLTVGLIGNILILATMTRPRLRGTSTCVYLCSMAVLDLMVLIAGLTPNWLEGAEYVNIKVNSCCGLLLQYLQKRSCL